MASWLDKPQFQNKKTQNGTSSIPKDLWKMCKECNEKIMLDKLEASMYICPFCNAHMQITHLQRLQHLADAGTFVETEANISSADPLSFTDAKNSYKVRIDSARSKYKINEAVVTGHCKINTFPVVVSMLEFRFIGGSMGSAVGEKIYRAMLLALKKKCPFIAFSCSGGARMQEGLLSLVQMAKTCAGAEQLSKAGIPFISVFTHPTMGGVTASYASIADVVISEPHSHIGFAGPRVIEQTVKQTLPEGFQTAEFLQDHGFVDMIVPRNEMKEKISNLLELLCEKKKKTVKQGA